ncbi:MAG: hypothetical protein JNK37_06005 [Verrucomicrobiales bacterium]|nr:hypothetical protein [Verrucomicrobiales bacterium]
MSYEDILAQTADTTAPERRRAVPGHLAVRVDDGNPNHHLWNNRGTWWCHFTLHKPDYTAERIRVSLKTRDLELARRRRDTLLAAI